MGGAVAAVPGRQTTTEEEYRIWALDADGFTAILFTNRDDLPAGSLRMDSVIEWLTASDRAQLESEFSAEGQPAYVFLLEKEPGRWFELICAVLTLGGAAFAGWLLLTKRGLMTTKLWKSMAAAGDPDEILTDLNDPKYARSGFAVARKYVHVNGVVIPRAGMQCAALTDENGDIKLIFERADGWTTEYYPDEDEYQTLKSLLPIKE